MEVDASSLEVAKSSFLSILSSVDPGESASFVEWVIHHCSNITTNTDTVETANDTSTTSAEKRLKNIVKDIKKRVPLQGIMASENICHPEEGEVMYQSFPKAPPPPPFGQTPGQLTFLKNFGQIQSALCWPFSGSNATCEGFTEDQNPLSFSDY